MAELNNSVGEILKKLDALGIADNTIVMFTSDNGPEIFTWPDGGNTPFRGEKGTTWECDFRTRTGCPRFVDAAGGPDVKQKLLTGKGGQHDVQDPP